MHDTQIETPAALNTILVFEEDGKVQTRFCTEAQANAHLETALDQRSGGSAFTLSEPNLGIELTMELFPGVRERVKAAKDKLQRDMRFRDTLDKHNVPRDTAVRASIAKAFDELYGANYKEFTS